MNFTSSRSWVNNEGYKRKYQNGNQPDKTKSKFEKPILSNNQPGQNNLKETNNYGFDSQKSLDEFHQQSVEDYVGTGGKEYETAAEKIVENYMGDYMNKYMNEWYIKYCTETGKYCDQIKVMHHHKGSKDEQRPSVNSKEHNTYTPSLSASLLPTNPHIHHISQHNQQQLEGANQNHNNPNYPEHDDNINDQHHYNYNSFFEKPVTNEMHQLIERDKFNHNFNQQKSIFENNIHMNDPIMPIWDDKYHHKQNSDNHFSPNGAKSSPTQIPHNFPGPAQEDVFDNDLDFELFEAPRHKLFSGRDKGKRRLRKQKRKYRPRLSNNNHLHQPARNRLTKKPQSYDSYMDLDYIEEMFTGTANTFDDYNMFEQKLLPPPPPRGNYNGYSMIEETDIDSIDRSFKPKHRLF